MDRCKSPGRYWVVTGRGKKKKKGLLGKGENSKKEEERKDLWRDFGRQRGGRGGPQRAGGEIRKRQHLWKGLKELSKEKPLKRGKSRGDSLRLI